MKNDEDAPCDICRSKESELTNEMIFCDMCDVCVHQACYGVTEIPKGQWFCKPCEQNIRPKCVFCPSTKGAMKKTKNGNWAHVSCTLWIPEVSFAEPEKLETIINIEKIPKSRWSLTCALCHMRAGACIQCYVKRCKTAYHVTCAFEFKLHMEMEDIEDSEQEIKFESFCETHTKLFASGQNPHENFGSSRRRKKPQDNQESNENNIGTEFIQNQAHLEEENRASTSHDTGIPAVSVAQETIKENVNEGNVNNVQNEDSGSKTDAGILNDQGFSNIPVVSKATARKSFSLPPKKIPPKNVLSQILPQLNGKPARNPKVKSDKPKRVRNKPSSPKKSKTKQPSSKKTKPLDPNPPTHFSPYQEKNATQSEQPSSNEANFSGVQRKRPLSNSSDSIGNIRQPSPSPKRQASASTSNEQKFLPSSYGQTFNPGQNEPSGVAVGFQDNPTSSALPKKDNYYDFSRYVVSLLRTLPFKKALRVQKQIVSLILKEHGSSEEESDVSSLSSDE